MHVQHLDKMVAHSNRDKFHFRDNMLIKPHFFTLTKVLFMPKLNYTGGYLKHHSSSSVHCINDYL